MKKVKKPAFFVVLILIAAFAASVIMGVSTYYGDISKTYVKGVDDIRFGIDIRGGVDVTFTPSDGIEATVSQLDAAKEVIAQRMLNLGITDYECYIDENNSRIIVRFPWKEGETNFDPEAAVKELGETAELTFREGIETDETGLYSGVTLENVILVGSDIEEAFPAYIRDPNTGMTEWLVSLRLTADGTDKFAEATTRLYPENGIISIWMDQTCVSYPTVQSAITNGEAQISGDFDADGAKALADKINSGALPFKLVTASFSTISPTLGAGALDAMIQAGIIAFVCISLFMTILYRLPGFVSVIALIGQVAGTLAFISGYFSFTNSSILTIPGIAGIVLAVGMGVDANVITGERIKEELNGGKTLDGAISSGFKRAFSAILDGNVTMVLIAIILMGAFGTPDSIFSKILKPVFFMFGPSTAGTIYSFGYTLLVGVILNLFFGVFCCRVMITALSKFKFFRNPKLYCANPSSENKEELLSSKERAESKFKFDYIGKRKTLVGIAGALVAASILSTFIFGVNLDIQFKGGTIFTYIYSGDIDINEFQQTASDALGGTGVNVTTGTDFSTGKNNIQMSLASNQGISAEVQFELNSALGEKYAANELELLESSDITPSAGREFFLKCLVAVIFSFIVLIIYIAVRFKNIGGWVAGLCGIFALLHDCFVVYGTFVISGMSINANFMAVILTILGYSINNTIVIYDRVRENEVLYRNKKTRREIINLSVNQSLTRSINTSLTTIISMLVITIVAMTSNVTSIISFSFPMLIGLIAGTFSSLCFTCPFWYIISGESKKRGDKRPAKAKVKKSAENG